MIKRMKERTEEEEEEEIIEKEKRRKKKKNTGRWRRGAMKKDEEEKKALHIDIFNIGIDDNFVYSVFIHVLRYLQQRCPVFVDHGVDLQRPYEDGVRLLTLTVDRSALTLAAVDIFFHLRELEGDVEPVKKTEIVRIYTGRTKTR